MIEVTKDPDWRSKISDTIIKSQYGTTFLVDTETQRELIERATKRLNRSDLIVLARLDHD